MGTGSQCSEKKDIKHYEHKRCNLTQSIIVDCSMTFNDNSFQAFVRNWTNIKLGYQRNQQTLSKLQLSNMLSFFDFKAWENIFVYFQTLAKPVTKENLFLTSPLIISSSHTF